MRKPKINNDAGQGNGWGMDAAEPRAGTGISTAARRFRRLRFRPGEQHQTANLSNRARRKTRVRTTRELMVSRRTIFNSTE